MRTLTKEEAIEQHRKLWRWIAEETEKQGHIVEKYEYFEDMGIAGEDVPYERCYCCEFCQQQWHIGDPLPCFEARESNFVTKL